MYSADTDKVSSIRCRSFSPVTDEILTLPEVEQPLKVAQKGVYTMVQKAELPTFKVGGRWRFRHADLDAWIAKTRRPAGEEEFT
jgi:excisionase family DNA binding protein